MELSDEVSFSEADSPRHDEAEDGVKMNNVSSESPRCRKRQRLSRKESKKTLRASGDVQHPGEPMPFSGTEFDSPPSSPVGISLRTADYRPEFYYVGGDIPAAFKRRVPSTKQSFGSDTESEELASLATRYALEGDGIEVWAPVDCFTKFQGKEDPRFDAPYALDAGGMLRDDLQPLNMTKTTTITIGSASAYLAGDLSPIKGGAAGRSERDPERESRSRERQWKRVWNNMIKKELPRCRLSATDALSSRLIPCL
jgi:hypothetical protein